MVKGEPCGEITKGIPDATHKARDRRMSRKNDRWPMRGDMWERMTNAGVLVRFVKSVTLDGTISYQTIDGGFWQCQWPTWRQWARAAERTYRHPDAAIGTGSEASSSGPDSAAAPATSQTKEGCPPKESKEGEGC